MPCRKRNTLDFQIKDEVIDLLFGSSTIHEFKKSTNFIVFFSDMEDDYEEEIKVTYNLEGKIIAIEDTEEEEAKIFLTGINVNRTLFHRNDNFKIDIESKSPKREEGANVYFNNKDKPFIAGRVYISEIEAKNAIFTKGMDADT